jgi:hypothetical protein
LTVRKDAPVVSKTASKIEQRNEEKSAKKRYRRRRNMVILDF